jgi:Putative amidoligase enzyme
VVWRFQAPPQTTGSDRIHATVVVLGAGGTRVDVPYTVECGGAESGSVRETPPRTFEETRRIPKLPMRPVPHDQRFGVELELTSTEQHDTSTIASTVSYRLRNTPMRLVAMDSYGEAKRAGPAPPHEWRLVPDSSIACSRADPNCNRFELVSPILRGGRGLHEIDLVLRALQSALPLRVNKSMGFHVHVDVSDLSVSHLVNVCQNFCRYEDVMDALQPMSRRTNSPESDRYFRSNLCSFDRRQRHEALETFRHHHNAADPDDDVRTLAHLMNPPHNNNHNDGYYDGNNNNSNNVRNINARFYKLNLQNLVTGRQRTVEFRQHSATFDFAKVAGWVRFCVNFVRNSSTSVPPPPPRRGMSNGDGGLGGSYDDDHHHHRDDDGSRIRRMVRLTREFDVLFQTLIKDRALKLYYQKRMGDLEVKRMIAQDQAAAAAVDGEDDPYYLHGGAVITKNRTSASSSPAAACCNGCRRRDGVCERRGASTVNRTYSIEYCRVEYSL